MYYIFFILLAFSTTMSWFRFCPRTNSTDRISAIYLLVVMMIMLFLYSSSLNQLGYLIMDFSNWKKKYEVDFGLLPGWLNATQFVFHVFGGLVAVISTLIMARYKDQGRIWLMRVIPVVALTQGVAFYRGYANEHGIEKTQHTLLLFVMISLLLHAAIFLFFDSVRMRKYFKAL